MIGTINVTVNAQHPNVPLAPVFAWRGSASRINVEGVPCLCGSWYVSAVSISVSTPDGKTVTYPCARTCNGIYSATVEATDTPGKSANGITVTATDEDGKDFVLGRGDLYILDGDAIPSPGDVSWTVRLLSSKPESPKEGDAYFDGDGTLMVYSDGSWRNTMPSATVPTKVSELENDAGYITSEQVEPSATYNGFAERAGYAVDAEFAHHVQWSGVTDKPTSLEGYGITDAANKTELDTKADKAIPSASAALLADSAVAVVDGSAGGETAVSFKPPSGNALRYCELMLIGVASDGAATLVLPAGTYQFADGADSVPKGNSHFCLAEYARGKWLVTRQSTTEKAVEEAGA